VVISVSDTGMGMPEAIRQRAFEPFFTTKELGRGTGLGLSTVYGFVKQSHGAIALESAPGIGTTITIALPAAPVAAGESAAGTSPNDGLPPGLRVMLVEDDLDVLEVALRFLEGLGCAVAAFTSAEEALRAIEAGEALDLLLSDVVLGAGMRGTELARRVRVLRPGMPVLLASGYSSEAARRDSVDPPDLLAKPYDRDQLSRAIARALRAPA
jgi:CheY-like chemotaxis protein